MTANAKDILHRIQTEAQGTSAHGLVLEYLSAKREELLASVTNTPDDELAKLKARLDLVEAIRRDLTRKPQEIRPVKTGGYTS